MSGARETRGRRRQDSIIKMQEGAVDEFARHADAELVGDGDTTYSY